VALCAILPRRRAVIAAYVAAWLFLPIHRVPIVGMPDWTKVSATSLSLLVGILIFDLPKVLTFRPRWIDLPMLVWCLCPVVSSVINGLGLYDGVSTSLDQVVTWGIPYFLGRLYLGDIDGLRDLAFGFLIGGLVYVPLCLYEIRMSPQLHHTLYGYHQHSFSQTHRFGGWRPTVFMDHGLMVGMWMSMASLAGIWLWTSGALKPFRGIAPPWFLVPLLITTVLCKSAGALVLLLGGLTLLWWVRRRPGRVPIYLLGVVAPLYILVRLTGLWSGGEIVEAVKAVSVERAASVEARLRQETMLAARAMQQPVFGWGRSRGRWRVRDESGRDITVTDGQWIIEFAQRGFVGLGAWLTVFLLPGVALLRRIPPPEWTRAFAASAAALAVVVGLYLVDCIPNAHLTPVVLLAAGGLTGLLIYREPAREPPAPVTGS